MCGIIGYIGYREVTPILINGLERMEYRGYDSAGICVSNGVLKTLKKKGKVGELKDIVEKTDNLGNIGIAHTRWATHGEPNEINAHPHSDKENNIAIVHNGIIENHFAIKKLLEKEGYKFKSDTDSEIVAHLISKFYVDDLEGAVNKALKFLEGTFGLAIVSSKEDKIIAAKRGSPLAIGVGEGEMFVASDVSAIIEFTKKVIYLEDDQFAVLTKETCTIKTMEGKEIDPSIEEIKWNVREIEKSGYNHFMLKEIFEQGESLSNTLRGRIKGGRIIVSLNFDLNQIDKIILVACGTSWHSALIGKHFIEKIAKIPCEVDYASEFRYRDPILSKNDLVIAISQSGETADTLAAIKEAKSKKAKIMGIVNAVGSSISREVDSGIYLHAGPEIGVASTKAFTSQVMALLLFALYLKNKKGEELDRDLLDEINNISSKVKEILSISPNIKEIANKYQDSKNFLYLGRGLNFPVALEGALKLKEISYIHAEGYPAAEMKHGPIALIDENMPVVFICPKDDTYEKVLSNMQEVKARKGKIIAIINENDEKLNKLADHIIKIPSASQFLSPILNVIPLQLFAYYVADFKGLDVDKPRNLAKSVTVE